MPATYAFLSRLHSLSVIFLAVLVIVLTAPYCNYSFASEDVVRVIEGDILVAHNPYSRSIAVPSANRPWVNGIVPYRIDSLVPAVSVRAINDAIKRWNDVSSITLVSLDGGDKNQTLLTASNDVLIFQPGVGCASWVGRQGGAQQVWVAPNCTMGSVMHEIGHALGLEHEHTRPDRDQFIEINWGNIVPSKRHNFNLAPTGSRSLGDYDYDSIMHYGPKNFSANGQATISPRFGTSAAIGQRRSPSDGDLAAIARLYASDLAVITQVYSDNLSSMVSIHVSNNHLQGAHDINLIVTIGDNQLSDFIHDNWVCRNTVSSQLDCKLERLDAGASSELQFNLDRISPSEQIRAEVSSKTPDDNLQNNANSANSANEAPVLGEAIAAQDDAVGNQNLAGGLTPAWLGLLLLLFHRHAGVRIYRYAIG